MRIDILFFCIVLLNAHPISKSNSHNISELVNKLDNGHIVQSYSTDQLLNQLYPTWKGQIFEEHDGNTDDKNKLDFSKIPKKHIKFKRITTKIMDLREFERLENFGNQKYLHNSIKAYKVKEKESQAANNLKQNTNSHLDPVSRFFENKHVFYDISIEPTSDDTEFAGTAEIEAILNEIKQKEIQIIADQIPSVSNLISNTVTETTFASMPLISDSSIYPGLVFSTFLLVDNNSLVDFKKSPLDSRLRYPKLHNIALRSVKDESSTLAHDVENMLQKKIKNVYQKIKKKISRDFDAEVKKTKATVKEQVDKIKAKTSTSKIGSGKSSIHKATTKPIPKTQTKSILHEARNSRNTLFNIRKHKQKLTTLTTHTIPTVGDDLSMLSIVEQLLEKSEEDNAINMLTTKNSYSAKKDKKKLFKRHSLHETLEQSSRKFLNNDAVVLDTEYTQSDNSINNDTEDLKPDATTEDTSYEGLSNKLSYSDYVNGFKYYLKFQKDNEDQKYSNQVRYQAHKHHSVDDIGKFILNKIPQLPTPRLTRDFINSKTFDDQDVSTKSKDSWFKKHFFIFMDSNTPKKFHTSQTVSLKPSAIQIKSIFFANQTTKQTYNNQGFPYLVPRRFKKNVHKAKNISTINVLDDPRYNVETEARRIRMLRKLRKRSNMDNHYNKKADTLTSIHYKKNGFVDIDMINKPTAIIKLNNKNKKTNKIHNIFNKIRFGHNKHNKKEKRQSQNRFNIFKGIRNIFKEKNEGENELKHTKRHKIFDYEVMTTNMKVAESYEVPKLKKLSKIEDLKKQIPNISADFSVPHTIFSESYINLTGLGPVSPGQRNEKYIYKKKPQLDEDRKSFSILTGSQYLRGNQQTLPVTPSYYNRNTYTESNQKELRYDDIINVNIKTNDIVYPENSNTVGYPLIMGRTKNIIRNEVDDISMKLLNFDAKNKKQKNFFTNVRNGYKNLHLLPFNTYPKSKSKEYQIEKVLTDDENLNNNANFKKPATMSGSANIIYLSKKSPRNDNQNFLINSNYSLSLMTSLNPIKDKKVKIDTKSNSHDFALKTFNFQSTPLVDPTLFEYRKSLNNLTKPDKKNVLKKSKLRPNSFEDPTIFAYEQPSNTLTTKEGGLAATYNDNVDIIIKRPFTKVNTPPEQYYSTPLPMQMDDFYKFLKSENIDVDSVTAPLFDSVPRHINTWNLYKKNMSKVSSKHDKMVPNKENLKTFHKNHKEGGQSDKNHSHLNLNKLHPKKLQAKKIQTKPRSEKQKDLVMGKDKNRNKTGETPEYENCNYLLRNEKHKRNLRKNYNLRSHLNLGSMDLFQLDNSIKQPVGNSQKESKDMDVTIIDLESKKFGSNAYKELSITNFNKMNKYQQLRTTTNLSNNDISRITVIERERDPLRFTHMYNEHTSPQQSMNSPSYSYIHKKTSLSRTQPRRVQISGHSYKYDIIYQKPNYDWMSDLYEVNSTLFTDNIVNYRNYPTTIKTEKRSDQWYYRGGNHAVYRNNNLIPFASNKVKKDIFTLNHTFPEYTSTEEKAIVLPKKQVNVAKLKSKKKIIFINRNLNNIDDEVYFEPLIRHKTNRSKIRGKVSSNNNKCYKRDVRNENSFTAKDVAALEVVVDLMKSTESFDEKGFRNTFIDIDTQKNIPYIIPSLKPQNHATNAIQVHIALPSNINDKKRSLEPIKVRKVFTAIMSSPVDLEYQIHSFEDDRVTKVPSDLISPGLYLLVENTNITVPKGNFVLKPIRSHIGISNLFLPKSSDSIMQYKSNMSQSINNNLSKITLNPDIIAAVNNQLVKLYESMATLNDTKSKRFIKKEEREENKQKIKRNINWEFVKQYFGHDRVCQCHCKINKTMCKPCAASDAVMTELIFEFDNLAKYMTDHCTEIQTFFSMNPTGGRKLKDTVHRLDTILNNYHKRVKGKCQGRTCKMISSSIDKREYKINMSISQFLNNLESLADYLQKVKQHDTVCDASVHEAVKQCVDTINKCIDKQINKRSYTSNLGELDNKKIYSLNNIRVNLICNKDLTKHATYFTRNTITEVLFERNTNTPLYYDEDEIKKDNTIGKGIKELLRKYSNKIKFKKVETSEIEGKNNRKLTKKHNKRHSVSYNQIEAPFLADSGGTFWYKYLHDNMREPRQQKDILNESITKRTISIKSKFSNMNYTTTNITNKSQIANTRSASNNNLYEKGNETDDISFNIDSLNHNLNDLFSLLGNTNTLQGNKTKSYKLTTLSKKQSSTNIHSSIKTKSKLTNTTKVVTTTTLSSKTTSKEDHLKLDSSKSQQNTNKEKEKESKATKTVSTKTQTPIILHTIKTTISTPKVGLINRIVSSSLKFLGNNDNKETTLAETKSSQIENRPMEYVKKYRHKFGAITDKYSLKENYNYEIDTNDTMTTLTEPTIIIINDISSSAKYTESINNKSSSKSKLIEFHSPETVKRNSFKLLKEKSNIESPEDEMNDIGFISLNTRVKLKNTTQKVSHLNNCEYDDYDIINSIKTCLGLTSSNLKTPSERKGAINKFFDKFSIQRISDSKKIKPDEKKENHYKTSSKVIPKLDLKQFNVINMSLHKNASDTIKSSTTKTTAAIANTTANKSKKDKAKLTTDKTNHTQSDSGSRNHVTKHLEEAGEEKLNQICDISSTMAYVSKLQKNMLKNNFEQYVKNVPCHKYNKLPQYFILRSCIRKQSKTYSKLNQRSKTFDINRKRMHKWVWIRDKRSILKDKATAEYDKGLFKDLEEKDLSGCSVPFIVTNCVNIENDNGNEDVSFHRKVKNKKKLKYYYNIKRKNIEKNMMFPKKKNIIHNIGFKKRNLLSLPNYLLRRGYKKNSDINGNFIQLWYGENDYYENFVRRKNGIYRKSLKRRKRSYFDMSELNNGLLNLPPLDPFTDEIYVMVANSISFDCHSPGPTKTRHADYIWTSDRLGILDFDNVMIEGPKVFINRVKTNNFGNYLCSAENAIVRSIKITVIDLPHIDIVFTPVYKTDTCTYDDLKSLQNLSEPMSYYTDFCSVRIDEPICLKNSVDGSALIRPTVVMTVKRQNNINCSAECLRDLQCSLALLFAKNAPALAFVKVLISYNGTKRILSPLRERKRSFVTHTLRRKDTNGHREYHKLAADMDPNSVNVVLLCSAGFYLVVGQKICAVCPPNTFSLEGENVCRNCPRGARSEPGARSCRLSLHLQRNKCPWKYVCGGAVCMLSCVIASCYAVSRLLRQPVSTEEIKTCRKTRKAPRKESHEKKSKNRPLSPSRVILSRLLRGSLSSSRATDSQETRFELWKEKNTLPPLPPIDFEF